MADPFSLGALGAVALTEGIKFLYAQAGEVLKRRRERRDALAKQAAPPQDPIPVQDPDQVLEGHLEPLRVDDQAADELADEIKRLRAELGEYAAGTEVPDEDDEDVVRQTRALRDALESVVGQRITFRGEARDPSGTPVITGRVTAREIRGRASGVEAGAVTEGVITGSVDAGTVSESGDVAGVRLGDVGRGTPGGGPRPRG